MKDNPAHVYRDIAKKIVAKLRENLTLMVEQGKAPDLYWKPEQAIIEAMRYADQCGAERMKEHFENMMADFDNQDGPSSQ